MEQTPDTFSSLFWAYTVIWIILAGYIFSLLRRVRRLEKTARQNPHADQER